MTEKKKPKILLHACCAPCLSQALTVLQGNWEWERVLPEKPDYDISVYFFNPNIHPQFEYIKRGDEVERLCKLMGNVQYIEGVYDVSNWIGLSEQLQDEPEGGKRCKVCFRIRLERTFNYAKENGYQAVATTLTLSPHKNAEVINEIGKELSDIYGIHYFSTDFKKQDGYKNSIKLSEKYELYRQDYCGCVYSKRDLEKSE